MKKKYVIKDAATGDYFMYSAWMKQAISGLRFDSLAEAEEHINQYLKGIFIIETLYIR